MRHTVVSLSLFALTLTYCLYAFAHNAPVDEIGCHTDPSSGSYHCLAGPLAGLEFATKDEAEEAFQKKTRELEQGLVLSPTKTENAEDKLSFISWRLRKGAAAKIDFDRVASVLATSDLAVFQDVEFNANGETNLNVIATVLERRLNEKICRGWIKNAKGVRGSYGFLWRERLLGYVEPTGEVMESCAARPWVLRTEAKNSVTATFFWKSSRRLFVLSSAAFDRDQKDPARAYRGYADFGWPVLVVGENATRGRREAQADMKKFGFKAAVPAGVKSARAAAAIWHKNLTVLSMASMDLHELFRDLPRSEVDVRLGESLPLRAELTFQEVNAEAVQTQLLAKKKGKGPASTKMPVLARVPQPTYPGSVSVQQFSDLSEDIESEAVQSEPVKSVAGAGKGGISKSSKRRKKNK